MIEFERGDVFYRRLHPDVISNYFPKSHGKVPARGAPASTNFAKLLASGRNRIKPSTTMAEYDMWKKALREHVTVPFPAIPKSAAVGFIEHLDKLIQFEDTFTGRLRSRTKDAVLGGVTSAAGTAGLLAGAGLALKHKAPDLAKMLGTAAGQHIKVFNPWHTVPMMHSLPEASRLFGKELKATKAIEEVATGGKIPSIQEAHEAYRKTGIDPVKDIQAITDFKKKWGRSPGETMEKSVGLLSGMAATGVGVAGGAILSKKPEERKFSDPDTPLTMVGLTSRLDQLIEFRIFQPSEKERKKKALISHSLKAKS
jgi:hypothetical protein